jgi:hypothetical protein
LSIGGGNVPFYTAIAAYQYFPTLPVFYVALFLYLMATQTRIFSGRLFPCFAVSKHFPIIQVSTGVSPVVYEITGIIVTSLFS